MCPLSGSPDGSGLVYSTYLGGTGFDAIGSVSVDASGEALLAGVTGSSDFPITPGAFSHTYQGGLGRVYRQVRFGGFDFDLFELFRRIEPGGLCSGRHRDRWGDSARKIK
jgi:hypothetical protein